MSWIPVRRDSKLIIGDSVFKAEQHQSQKATTTPSSDDKTQKADSEEIARSTQEPVEEVTKQDVLSSAGTTEATAAVLPITKYVENDEIKSIPSTSTVSIESHVSIEAVKSAEPNDAAGSILAQPSAGRVLLKRRRSRISVPTVLAPSSSIVEVDSAPRPSKRRSQKKQMIALFLESDYPRRK